MTFPLKPYQAGFWYPAHLVFSLIPEPNLMRVISANTSHSSPGADALATVIPPPHATRTDTSSPMIVTSGPAPATSWT